MATLTIKINDVPDNLLEKGFRHLSDISGVTFKTDVELECTPEWLFGHLIKDRGSFAEFLAIVSNQLLKQNLTATQQKDLMTNIEGFMKNKNEVSEDDTTISDDDKKWVDNLLDDINKPENLN